MSTVVLDKTAAPDRTAAPESPSVAPVTRGTEDRIPAGRRSWQRRQVLLVAGVLAATAVLVYLNRDAIDLSLWSTRMHVGWVLLAVVGSALTLAGNAWNLIGASPVRLPFWPTYGAQAAGTVARLVSPAALGGAAVNVQYLRRSGVGGAASVGTVSVAQTVQLVSAFVLLPPVAIMAGLRVPGIPVPTLWVVIAVVAALGVFTAVAAFLLRRRPLLEARVRVLVAELAGSLRTIARRPARAAVSLGGALLITVALVGTMWASVYAFGGSIGLLTATAVLLFGSTAGNAIPVPGGVGTVDAALVAALAAAGVGLSVAIPAVALHRLLTLWLQVPAGLIAAGLLRRRGAL